MKKARYYGIPCYFNPETDELKGRNYFYDILVGMAVWWDVNFSRDEDFKIILETNDN